MTEKEELSLKCSVSEDGLHILPCRMLTSVFEYDSPPSKKGIVRHQLHNIQTGKPSRTFFSAKSGDYKKMGLALNFCPFCGEKIDAPFAEKEDEQQS